VLWVRLHDRWECRTYTRMLFTYAALFVLLSIVVEFVCREIVSNIITSGEILARFPPRSPVSY
jgi:hypothetical protein